MINTLLEQFMMVLPWIIMTGFAVFVAMDVNKSRDKEDTDGHDK